MSGPGVAALAQALVDLGASHILGIPDNTTGRLYETAGDAGLEALIVCREGEAFAIASGLWLGGARPVVVIQNTGLLESGDALRGTAVRMGVPLLVLVGYRGSGSLVRMPSAVTPRDDPGLLRRADLDSVAVLCEPTLQAWGVPYHELNRDADLSVLATAWAQAQTQQRPVAVLLRAGLG